METSHIPCEKEVQDSAVCRESIIWDSMGHSAPLVSGHRATVIADHYCMVLWCMKEAIWRKCPG